METIDIILKECIKLNATDLHIKANSPLWIRINGKLIKANYKGNNDSYFSNNDIKNFFKFFVTDEKKKKIFDDTGSIDFGYSTDFGNFRICFYLSEGAYSLAIRILPGRIKTLEELGLPQTLKDIIHYPNGLVLVTGATGNGKTTTLATLINEINQIYQKHIITIEDPIEYRYENAKSLVTQREIGADCDSFNSGLRSALRQNPDIILIGEMRDKETIKTAIEAAQTGHLVFATLHTNSAFSTIERIMSSFDGSEQTLIAAKFANCFRAIVSQVLLPRLDEKGLVVATEVLFNIPSIKNLIREEKYYQISSFMKINKQNGIITLEDSLCKLVKEGKVSKNEALSKANDIPFLESIL